MPTYVRRHFACLLGLLCAASACSRVGATPPGRQNDPSCGMSPSDWCAGPEGDPCSMHANETECRADPKCKGTPYRGESLVACQDDGQGFSKNCPSVGCVSK